MHNAGFKELGLDYTYVPFQVNPTDLKAAVNSLRTLNFKGANITVPHKEEVIDYLDEISEDAFLIGAVNTIVNNCGCLIGDNTDSKGFLAALKEAGVKDINKLKVVVLGAGGASKAGCIGLLRENVKQLVVANRTIRKAELLLENFKKPFKKTKLSICGLDMECLKEEFKDCDVLVNTTSVGMAGDCLKLPLESLKKGALVYDMVYNPPKTKLLKKAEKLGYKTKNGLSMLLYQGALGFEIWTKQKAPVEVMRKALTRAAYEVD
jgi:shikimate dehydrogenase